CHSNQIVNSTLVNESMQEESYSPLLNNININNNFKPRSETLVPVQQQQVEEKVYISKDTKSDLLETLNTQIQTQTSTLYLQTQTLQSHIHKHTPNNNDINNDINNNIISSSSDLIFEKDNTDNQPI